MASNDTRPSRRPVTEPLESIDIALESFFFSIHRLSTALGESKILAGCGIGISEWAVLKVLGDNEVYQQHVLRKSGVSRQRIRKLLQELEAKGLVTVTRAKGDDKRQMIVAVTPRGIQTRRAALARLNEIAPELGGFVKSSGADAEKFAKRLQGITRFSDRVSNAIRRNAKGAVDDWPEGNDR